VAATFEKANTYVFAGCLIRNAETEHRGGRDSWPWSGYNCHWVSTVRPRSWTV